MYSADWDLAVTMVTVNWLTQCYLSVCIVFVFYIFVGALGVKVKMFKGQWN